MTAEPSDYQAQVNHWMGLDQTVTFCGDCGRYTVCRCVERKAWPERGRYLCWDCGMPRVITTTSRIIERLPAEDEA